MEYELINGKSIHIALEGKFRPAYFSPIWFIDHGLIDREEVNNKGRKFSEKYTAFFIGKDVRIECSEVKLSLIGSVTVLSRMLDILKAVLECKLYNELSGAVFAEMFVAKFLNPDDAYKFGDHYVPLKNWYNTLNDPRVVEFTVHGREDKERGIPDTYINVRSVKLKQDNDNNVKICIGIYKMFSKDAFEVTDKFIELLRKQPTDNDDLLTKIYDI